MAMSERSGNRDLVREFLSYIQVEKGLSANTLQSYARDIAKLQSWAVNASKQVERFARERHGYRGCAGYLPRQRQQRTSRSDRQERGSLAAEISRDPKAVWQRRQARVISQPR